MLQCLRHGVLNRFIYGGIGFNRQSLAALSFQFTCKSARILTVEKMTPREWWLKNVVGPSTPLQREQTPEDIGRTVVFLVSEDA